MILYTIILLSTGEKLVINSPQWMVDLFLYYHPNLHIEYSNVDFDIPSITHYVN